MVAMLMGRGPWRDIPEKEGVVVQPDRRGAARLSDRVTAHQVVIGITWGGLKTGLAFLFF